MTHRRQEADLLAPVVDLDAVRVRDEYRRHLVREAINAALYEEARAAANLPGRLARYEVAFARATAIAANDVHHSDEREGAMPRWRPLQAPTWSPTRGIGTTIRAPRPRTPPTIKHLIGKTCGRGGAYVSDPLRVTCARCWRRAAEEVLARRRAGEPPRWAREVEEKIVGWYRRNRRITTRRAS